jgi:hypothetical protein
MVTVRFKCSSAEKLVQRQYRRSLVFAIQLERLLAVRNPIIQSKVAAFSTIKLAKE